MFQVFWWSVKDVVLDGYSQRAQHFAPMYLTRTLNRVGMSHEGTQRFMKKLTNIIWENPQSLCLCCVSRIMTRLEHNTSNFLLSDSSLSLKMKDHVRYVSAATVCIGCVKTYAHVLCKTPPTIHRALQWRHRTQFWRAGTLCRAYWGPRIETLNSSVQGSM